MVIGKTLKFLPTRNLAHLVICNCPCSNDLQRQNSGLKQLSQKVLGKCMMTTVSTETHVVSWASKQVRSQEKGRRKTRRSGWVESWVCKWNRSHRGEKGKSMRKHQIQGAACHLQFWGSVERKHPNMKGTEKGLADIGLFIHSVCISEVSIKSQTLWALAGWVRKPQCLANQVYIQTLSQSILWCVFEPMSTGFLLCCMKRLNEIIVLTQSLIHTHHFYPLSADAIWLRFTLSILEFPVVSGDCPTQRV